MNYNFNQQFQREKKTLDQNSGHMMQTRTNYIRIEEKIPRAAYIQSIHSYNCAGDASAVSATTNTPGGRHRTCSYRGSAGAALSS